MNSLVNLLALLVLGTAFVPEASAVEPGTYDLKLSSKNEMVNIEVRCPTWHGTTVCEVAGSDLLNGEALPIPPPRTVGLDLLGGCKEPPKNEWAECDVGLWQQLDEALTFARDHLRFQPDAQRRKLLEPLFTSGAHLTKCESLQQNLGVTLCELSASPWGKPTLLYVVSLMAPCDPNGPFCGYALWPVFKTSAEATQYLGIDPLLPQPAPLTAPVAQEQVAAYVDRLRASIRSALVVPMGTPPSARVAYRIEFEEITGRVTNVYFTGGCYCPAFRAAVTGAVYQIQPLPLLPEEQRAIVGKRVGRNYDGKIYLETLAGPQRSN
jgi:hypothetical protein